MLKNILSLMPLASMAIVDHHHFVLQPEDMNMGTPIRVEADISLWNNLALKLGEGDPVWNARVNTVNTVDEDTPTELLKFFNRN